MKFNGPELERILTVSHWEMRNWRLIEKLYKRNKIFDAVCITLAIGLMVYLCIR